VRAFFEDAPNMRHGDQPEDGAGGHHIVFHGIARSRPASHSSCLPSEIVVGAGCVMPALRDPRCPPNDMHISCRRSCRRPETSSFRRVLKGRGAGREPGHFRPVGCMPALGGAGARHSACWARQSPELR
jgi:hypothetical protein